MGARWLLPVVLVAAGVVMVTAVVVILKTRRGPTVPPAVPDAAAAQSAMWIAANLPAGSRVLSDDFVNRELRKLDVSRLRLTSDLDPAANAGPANFDYIVSTPSLRTASQFGGRGTKDTLAASVPIALFRAGAQRVAVEQVLPVAADQRSARIEADRNARAQAGIGLLDNARIHPDGQSASVLSQGALDLRPATLLALLADTTDVRVLGMPLGTPEKAAGMPSRTLRLEPVRRVSLASAIESLAGPYMPQSVTTAASGVSTIVWSPAVAPVQSVQ